jgi:tRNA U34 5-carboxymethylaminomethyl modifying GTPase MnmE/TrmE
MRKGSFLIGVAFAVCVAMPGAPFLPEAHAARMESFGKPPQQPESPPPQPREDPAPKIHKIKIWTNEDLIALRSPADLYILQKEAQATDSEAETLMSCFAFGPPQQSLEDTQRAIQETQQSIRDSEDAIAQSRNTIEDAPEALKARNQRELDRRNAELETSRQQLRALQEHLRELTKQSANENSATPAAPPHE